MHNDCIAHDIGKHDICRMTCVVPEIGTMIYFSLLCITYAMKFVSAIDMLNDCIAHDM